MIILKNIQTLSGIERNIQIDNQVKEEQVLDCAGLTMLPAVIDPHVHFRTPGLTYKEDWETGARAAIRGGCTTVFDMPNTIPPTITELALKEKFAIIDQQLRQAKIPLRYKLFFGADKHHFGEIARTKQSIIGIKVFMGCSTGDLVIDDDESLHEVFAIAKKENLIVAVHAEDEHMLQQQKQRFAKASHYAMHSQIRSEAVAACAVEKALSLAEKYGTRLYILHVSSEAEIELIKKAKLKKVNVFAETTPHHLFFDDQCYERLQGRAVVNPPLRTQRNREAVMIAIKDKIIDTIGSDHAPHTAAEKALPYPACPSGMPGIEFMLPLLLNASAQGALQLREIVDLTSTHAREIFSLPETSDVVLVDLQKEKQVQETASKCGWTPYEGLLLKGWPVYTLCQGEVFSC